MVFELPQELIQLIPLAARDADHHRGQDVGIVDAALNDRGHEVGPRIFFRRAVIERDGCEARADFQWGV